MDYLNRLCPACEVTALSLRIAPDTVGVPMPCLDLQLRVLPVSYGLPSCSKNRHEDRPRQQPIGIALNFFFGDTTAVHFWSALTRPQPVYTRTQCADGAECVDHV